MNTLEKTKMIAKSLAVLAENDFAVQSVDFATGVVTLYVPGFDALVVKEDPNAPDEKYKMTKRERSLCDNGMFIDAIKAVRERTNMGLAEAKALCEKYRDAR